MQDQLETASKLGFSTVRQSIVFYSHRSIVKVDCCVFEIVQLFVRCVNMLCFYVSMFLKAIRKVN